MHALRYSQYTEDEKTEIIKNVKIEQGVPLIGDELDVEEGQTNIQRDVVIEQTFEEATKGAITEEDVAMKETSYNGAQIQSAVSIVQEFSAGTLSRDTAIAMLQEFLKVNVSIANKMLVKPKKVKDL
jgi:hypothetical protein